MGALGYSACIYDRDYPCSYGCGNSSCTFYTDDDDDEEEDDDG